MNLLKQCLSLYRDLKHCVCIRNQILDGRNKGKNDTVAHGAISTNPDSATYLSARLGLSLGKSTLGKCKADSNEDYCCCSKYQSFPAWNYMMKSCIHEADICRQLLTVLRSDPSSNILGWAPKLWKHRMPDFPSLLQYLYVHHAGFTSKVDELGTMLCLQSLSVLYAGSSLSNHQVHQADRQIFATHMTQQETEGLLADIQTWVFVLPREVAGFMAHHPLHTNPAGLPTNNKISH